MMSHSTISANDVTRVNGEVRGPGELLPAFMGLLVTRNEIRNHLQSFKTISQQDNGIITIYSALYMLVSNIASLFIARFYEDCITVYFFS